MHADRSVSGGIKRSVKDRLGDNYNRSISSQDPRAALKRQQPQCQVDSKWNHGFLGEKIEVKYPIEPVVRKIIPEGLTTTTVQKGLPTSSKTGIRSSLTEVPAKVLGMPQTQPANANSSGVSDIKGNSGAEFVSKNKSLVQSVTELSSAGQKRKVVCEGLTVASFLQSLGLSKYSITFQAEEIDMFALKHMNDNDLKAIGLPMGPRKKILFSIESAKRSRSESSRMACSTIGNQTEAKQSQRS